MTRTPSAVHLHDTARQKSHKPLSGAINARILLAAGGAPARSRLTGVLPSSMMELHNMPGEQAWNPASTVEFDKENAGTPSRQGPRGEGPVKSPASVCARVCRKGAVKSATLQLSFHVWQLCKLLGCGHPVSGSSAC